LPVAVQVEEVMVVAVAVLEVTEHLTAQAAAAHRQSLNLV
jgi:hypothetical protein